MNHGIPLNYPPIGGPRNNYAATTAPGVSNDVTQRYSVGSEWWDTTAEVLWRCVSPAQGAAVWVPNVAHPYLVTGEQYVPGLFTGKNNVAYAPTLATVMALIPISYPRKITASAVRIRVVTAGGAGAICKGAIFANSYTTGRGTGVALYANNTDVSVGTGTGNSNPSLAFAPTLHANVSYWFGIAVKTAAPTFFSVGGNTSSNTTFLAMMAGSTPSGSVASVWTVPYNYDSQDITTFDLTGATFTQVLTDQGMPIPYLTAA